MEQLSLFDLTQYEELKDQNEILADKIIKDVCEFVDVELLPHCFPLLKKETSFKVWDHVPRYKRNISIYYFFDGSYDPNKYISENDKEVDLLIGKSKFGVDKRGNFKIYGKKLDLAWAIAPNMLVCFVGGIDL